jgi:hypothetical protein
VHKIFTITFITTAGSWEKKEEYLHSVALGRNQKKFKRGHAKERGEYV